MWPDIIFPPINLWSLPTMDREAGLVKTTRYFRKKDRDERGVFFCSCCFTERPLSERVIRSVHSHRCTTCMERIRKAERLKLIRQICEKNH